MMLPHSNIYELSLDSRDKVIRWLSPYMPTCIALYRRLQFGNFSSASRLLSSVSSDTLEKGASINGPWIIAFVDRSCRPETEVWLTASWEHCETAEIAPPSSQTADLVRDLFKHISGLNVTTESVSSNGAVGKPASHESDTNGEVKRDDYEKHMSNSNIVLFGAIHDSSAKIFKELGHLDPQFVGANIPYRKYIFDLGDVKYVLT